MKILVPVSGYLKLSQISEKKKLKKTKDEKKMVYRYCEES